jgi:rhamnosyltransferase
MHDGWLALVAAACGDIQYVSNPLLDYRQHEGNVIGAEGEGAILRKMSHWRENWRRGETEFAATFDQAAGLLCRLKDRGVLSGKASDALTQYGGLLNRGVLDRAGPARRLKLREGKILLRSIFYLRLLFSRR